MTLSSKTGVLLSQKQNSSKEHIWPANSVRYGQSTFATPQFPEASHNVRVAKCKFQELGVPSAKKPDELVKDRAYMTTLLASCPALLHIPSKGMHKPTRKSRVEPKVLPPKPSGGNKDNEGVPSSKSNSDRALTSIFLLVNRKTLLY